MVPTRPALLQPIAQCGLHNGPEFCRCPSLPGLRSRSLGHSGKGWADAPLGGWLLPALPSLLTSGPLSPGWRSHQVNPAAHLTGEGDPGTWHGVGVRASWRDQAGACMSEYSWQMRSAQNARSARVASYV